jgi:hypothetical protein
VVCGEAHIGPRNALKAWPMASMVILVAPGADETLLPEQVRDSTHPDVVYHDLEDNKFRWRVMQMRRCPASRPGNVPGSFRCSA